MDIKMYVTDLLKNYHKLKSEIDLIKSDLQIFKGISYDEMIETLNFARPQFEGIRGSGISDKTCKIALNYKSDTDKSNAEICSGVYERQTELERLEYYISRLDEKKKAIIQGLYLEDYSWEHICAEMFISRAVLQRQRDNAVNEIANMYSICGVDISNSRVILS